jgi:hypothetical protein
MDYHVLTFTKKLDRLILIKFIELNKNIKKNDNNNNKNDNNKKQNKNNKAKQNKTDKQTSK